MLNIFLLAALAFGALGLISLIWSPATTGGASAVQAQTPIAGPVRLVPKNPPPDAPAVPDDLAACRHWFALRRQMEIKGTPKEEIDAYGVGLARTLLLASAPKEMVTDEA